jgi:transcriptional regulator with XRE-family HTH domain
VADDGYGAIVAKRRLARRLATMRTRAGLSLNDANDKLGWSRGRLDRFERNDWRLPDPTLVHYLGRIYQVSDGEQAELEDLTRRARERVWWRDYEEVFGKDNEFAGFENDAARISVYMPLLLPGLLQTRAYAQALLALGPRSQQWQEWALDARLRRQQILGRADGSAPRLVAVITEASLMYRWGTPEDRRAQVEHLTQMSRRANVDLRLLRFADGPFRGVMSPFNIFDFADDEDPSVAYVETDIALQVIAKPEDIRFYKEAFADIHRAALVPSATRNHFDELAETME